MAPDQHAGCSFVSVAPGFDEIAIGLQITEGHRCRHKPIDAVEGGVLSDTS